VRSLDARPEWRKLYNAGAWRKGRLKHLASSPLCVACQANGYVTAANVVDHIRPHKGDEALFFDRTNWQSLCKDCHDVDKKLLETSGRVKGYDANGMPLDPNHHWQGGVKSLGAFNVTQIGRAHV
jgi:5-methylcytosine-specific restriction endonuclease McrA